MFKKKISFLLNWYHFILAFLGVIFYCFPSRKLKIIGVTGTDGKTTTTEMIAKIFEEAGYKTSLINSIRFKIKDKEELNLLKMTMPGRFFIQKFLRKTINSGCSYSILEVTSEGILQHRHRFINFEVAVFTNLTPEHIERHGSFENYRATKGKLFQATKKIHIINEDDENKDYYLQFPANKKYLYQFRNQKGRIKIINQNSEILEEINNLDIKLKLRGEFNISNALAAICVCLSQGISLESCKKSLEKFEGVPGRMEEVISEPFKVFLDYAVTPASLQKVYEILSKESKIQNPKSKMICVLGACGGKRDKWKRPVLGQIAVRYCDKIIITNEDPYDENPYQILSMIKLGIFKSQFPISNFYEILDRREAIRKALELASPGDIIITTGKGSETWICLTKGKKIPWNEKEIIKEEFNKLQFD